MCSITFFQAGSFYISLFSLLKGKTMINRYSSVPNRRAGRNKLAGGKILKKH